MELQISITAFLVPKLGIWLWDEWRFVLSGLKWRSEEGGVESSIVKEKLNWLFEELSREDGGWMESEEGPVTTWEFVLCAGAAARITAEILVTFIEISLNSRPFRGRLNEAGDESWLQGQSFIFVVHSVQLPVVKMIFMPNDLKSFTLKSKVLQTATKLSQ